MCCVHFLRNVLKHLPKRRQEDIVESLREAEEKEEKLQELADPLREEGYAAAADTIERWIVDVGNYRAFPEKHWKRIRTTNMVERINKEVRRRVRKAGAILTDIHEEWMTGVRYLTMEGE
jgi:transposase-like protein